MRNFDNTMPAPDFKGSISSIEGSSFAGSLLSASHIRMSSLTRVGYTTPLLLMLSGLSLDAFAQSNESDASIIIAYDQFGDEVKLILRGDSIYLLSDSCGVHFQREMSANDRLAIEKFGVLYLPDSKQYLDLASSTPLALSGDLTAYCAPISGFAFAALGVISVAYQAIADSKSDEPGPESITGRLFDGPISGAKIYIDVNEDGLVSDGDYLLDDETDTDGRYEGEIPPEHAGKPFVADLTGARDEDRNVEVSGVYTAPAGSKVISPLTHWLNVKGDVDDLGLTEEEVTTIDPFDGQTPDDTDNKLATIAEIVADSLETKVEDLVQAERSLTTPAEVALTPDEIEEIVDNVQLAITRADNAPTAIILSSPTASVNENTATRTFLTKVTFVDEDGLGGQTTLTPSNTTLFEVVSTGRLEWDLYLKAGQAQDYEISGQRVHTFDLTGEGQRASFTLNITNIDDNDAVFRLSGTPQAPQTGQDLSVTTTTPDADGDNDTYTYQWYRSTEATPSGNDTAIGTDSATYTLTRADIDHHIYARVTYTDGAGASEDIATDVSASVTLAPYAPTSVIADKTTVNFDDNKEQDGLVTNGQASGYRVAVLTIDSHPAPNSFTLSNNNFEVQEIGDKFVLVLKGTVDLDQGGNNPTNKYTTTVTATNSVGSSPVSTEITVDITNVDEGDAVYVITGTLATGETLTAEASTDDPDGLKTSVAETYLWETSTDGTDWAEATNADSTSDEYEVHGDEFGKQIRVTVTYTDNSDTQATVTGRPTAPNAPNATIKSNTAIFEFRTPSGTKPGESLVMEVKADDPHTNGTFSYQWYRSTDNIIDTANDTPIGTDSATYTLTNDDIGDYIYAIVSYTDGADNVEEVEGPISANKIIVDNPVESITPSTTTPTPIPETQTTPTDSNGWLVSTITLNDSATLDLDMADADFTLSDSTNFALVHDTGKIWKLYLKSTVSLDQDASNPPTASKDYTTTVTVTSKSTGKAYVTPTITMTITNADEGDAVFQIDGDLSIGETLTVTETTADPDGMKSTPSPTYLWEVSNDNGVSWHDATNADSTSNELLLDIADNNKQIRVTITYTDYSNKVEEIVVPGSGTINNNLNALATAAVESHTGTEGATGDRVSFANSDAPVQVNLAENTAAGGHAEGDTLISIENITGSDHADTITGDANANILKGGAGTDTLIGGAGNDILDGGADKDTLTGGDGQDKFRLLNPASTPANADEITDFQRVDDTLVFANDVTEIWYEIFDGKTYIYASTDRTADTYAILTGEHDLSRAIINTLDGNLLAITELTPLTLKQGGNIYTSTIGTPDGFTLTDSKLTLPNAPIDAIPHGLGFLDGYAPLKEATPTLKNFSFTNHEFEVTGQRSLDLIMVHADNGDIILYEYNAALWAILEFPLTDDGTSPPPPPPTTANVYLILEGLGQPGAAPTRISYQTGTANSDTLTFTSTDQDLYYNAGEGSDTITGGAGDDIIRGGDGNDTLTGGAGNDILDGGAGGDILDGGEGNDTASYANSDEAVNVNLKSFLPGDTAIIGVGVDSRDDQGNALTTDILRNIENLIGSDHDDTLTGDDGDNVLEGGAGADRLRGGKGMDIASYASSGIGVTVDLSNNANNFAGHAAGDTFTSIEGVFGSAHSDDITGDDGDNYLSGGAGNDFLRGGAGDDFFDGGTGTDFMDGGAGKDTVSYASSEFGLTVDLSADADEEGFITTTHKVIDNNDVETTENGDRLKNIENIIGSEFADTLTGDANDNILDGGLGDTTDTLIGGAGDDTLIGGAGADSLDGGDGNDTASYKRSGLGVTVNLATSTYSGGDANDDTLTRIENITGSDHADTLTGDNKGNILTGGAGNDTLDGGAGNDTLDGGTGTDTLTGGAGNDRFILLNSGQDHYDTITDFDVTEDTLVFNDSISQIWYQNYAGGTVIFSSTGDIYAVLRGRHDLNDGDATIMRQDGTAITNITEIIPLQLTIGNHRYAPGPGLGRLPKGFTLTDFKLTLPDNPVNALTHDTNLDFDNSDYADLKAATPVLANFAFDIHELEISGKITPEDDLIVRQVFNLELIVHHVGNDIVLFAYNAALWAFLSGESSTLPTTAETYLILEGLGQANTDATRLSYRAGTLNADVIYGSERDDIIYGSGRDDIIYGSGRDDIIYSGEGADIIYSGTGDDTIYVGRTGTDIIDGGDGNDTVSYADSRCGVIVDLSANTDANGYITTTHIVINDQNVETFENKDKIINIENITGSVLDDTLTGDGNANILDGNAGDDRLYGNAGDDTLTGGDGNDLLIGGIGDDTLHGGAGDDTLNGGTGNNTIDGGTGTDRLILDWSSIDGAITFRATAPSSTPVTVTVNSMTTTYSNIELFTITGGTSHDKLFGGIYDDYISGGAGVDWITGAGGNDDLEGGAGADTIDGGFGIDTVSYLSSTAVTINLSDNSQNAGGDAEGDILHHIENVIGSFHADTIIGDAGANHLSGFFGNDTLRGGAGDDILQGDAGDDILDGGAGSDTASYVGSFLSVTADLSDDSNNAGGAAGDTFTSIENLIGSDHADTLTGDANSNIIEGGIGADTIDGGAGSDTASYKSSRTGVTVDLTETGRQTSAGDADGDTLTNIENIIGSDYADTLTGDAADNTIHGGAGDDTINIGTGGSDTIDGGTGIDGLIIDASTATTAIAITATTMTHGSDTTTFTNIEEFTITTGTGDDTITTGTGDDTITTGTGDDTITAGTGNDTIDGGAGSDTISYADSTRGVQVNLSGATDNNNFISVHGDKLKNIENITGSAYDDRILGDTSDNTLTGGAGDDTLRGDAGDDTLDGGAGDDNLRGDAGDDTLDGGAGDDILDGGAGKDTLTGGTGADTFRLSPTPVANVADADIITDFNINDDTLIVQNSPNQIWYYHVGGNTHIFDSAGGTGNIYAILTGEYDLSTANIFKWNGKSAVGEVINATVPSIIAIGGYFTLNEGTTNTSVRDTGLTVTVTDADNAFNADGFTFTYTVDGVTVTTALFQAVDAGADDNTNEKTYKIQALANVAIPSGEIALTIEYQDAADNANPNTAEEQTKTFTPSIITHTPSIDVTGSGTFDLTAGPVGNTAMDTGLTFIVTDGDEAFDDKGFTLKIGDTVTTIFHVVFDSSVDTTADKRAYKIQATAGATITDTPTILTIEYKDTLTSTAVTSSFDEFFTPTITNDHAPTISISGTFALTAGPTHATNTTDTGLIITVTDGDGEFNIAGFDLGNAHNLLFQVVDAEASDAANTKTYKIQAKANVTIPSTAINLTVNYFDAEDNDAPAQTTTFTPAAAAPVTPPATNAAAPSITLGGTYDTTINAGPVGNSPVDTGLTITVEDADNQFNDAGFTFTYTVNAAENSTALFTATYDSTASPGTNKRLYKVHAIADATIPAATIILSVSYTDAAGSPHAAATGDFSSFAPTAPAGATPGIDINGGVTLYATSVDNSGPRDTGLKIAVTDTDRDFNDDGFTIAFTANNVAGDPTIFQIVPNPSEDDDSTAPNVRNYTIQIKSNEAVPSGEIAMTVTYEDNAGNAASDSASGPIPVNAAPTLTLNDHTNFDLSPGLIKGDTDTGLTILVGDTNNEFNDDGFTLKIGGSATTIFKVVDAEANDNTNEKTYKIQAVNGATIPSTAITTLTVEYVDGPTEAAPMTATASFTTFTPTISSPIPSLETGGTFNLNTGDVGSNDINTGLTIIVRDGDDTFYDDGFTLQLKNDATGLFEDTTLFKVVPDGTDTAGDNAKTYKVQAVANADIPTTEIRLTVDYTDAMTNGNPAETVNFKPFTASAPTTQSAATFTLSGFHSTGETLTVSEAKADPEGAGTAYTYKWYRKDPSGTNADAVISGETNATYTLGAADIGSYIYATVSYMDGAGTPNSHDDILTPVSKEVVSAPTISVSNDPNWLGTNYTDGTVTYSETTTLNWFTSASASVPTAYLVAGLNIAGGRLTLSDTTHFGIDTSQGGRIAIFIKPDAVDQDATDPPTAMTPYTVIATVTNAAGVKASLTFIAIISNADEDDASFRIDGILAEGETLTARIFEEDIDGVDTSTNARTYLWETLESDGTWSPATNGAASSANTYTVHENEVGKQIRVTVSYTDVSGRDETVTQTVSGVIGKTATATGETFAGSTTAIDHVSYANSTDGVTVDLSGNVTLAGAHAVGDTLTSIENLTGSAHNDTLTGDASDNTLIGGAGDDTLIGGAGDDTLIGGAGTDQLTGGAGTDTASYARARDAGSGVGVTVDLSNTIDNIGTDALGDTFTTIENLIGSDYDDHLIGDAEDNTLTGGIGDDTLEGGAGADILNGGTGINTASYDLAAAAVIVNLTETDGIQTQSASNTDAAGDTLTNIANLIGSGYDDTLTGDGGDNILTGGAGDDTLIGGAGDDTLIGGTGKDTMTGGSGDNKFKLTEITTTSGETDIANVDVIKDFWQDSGNQMDISSLVDDGLTHVYWKQAAISGVGDTFADTVLYAGNASGQDTTKIIAVLEDYDDEFPDISASDFTTPIIITEFS